MDIRAATPADLDTLFDLHCTVFRHHIQEIWGWDEAWQRSRFEEECDASTVSVVQIDGRTVGYTQVASGDDRVYLQNIALHPDAQGRGIGTRLLEDIQRAAMQQEATLDLGVFRTNPRAVKFYERLGFRKTGQTDTHIKMSWQL